MPCDRKRLRNRCFKKEKMSKSNSFTLQLEQLHNFDTDVTSDFDNQLQMLVADCRKRPACKKNRTITLKIEAHPNEQDPEDVNIAVVVSTKIPAANHLVRRARTNSKNQLQLSFDQDEEV
jgi:hypothetical protein